MATKQPELTPTDLQRRIRAERDHHRAQLDAALDRLSTCIALVRLRIERQEPAQRLIGTGIEDEARNVSLGLLLLAQLERWSE